MGRGGGTQLWRTWMCSCYMGCSLKSSTAGGAVQFRARGICFVKYSLGSYTAGTYPGTQRAGRWQRISSVSNSIAIVAIKHVMSP